MKKGKFIVIEGGEGSGKSTMLQALKDSPLRDTIIFTREPGGTPFGEVIRETIFNPLAKDASAEEHFLLQFSSRLGHVKRMIAPSLRNGWNVVSDRFDSSTWAYQIYGQQGDNLRELFFFIKERFLRDCIPDYYIFLDVDPEIGLSRRKDAGGQNHFDERNIAFHKRVSEGYRDFLKQVPHKIIDANRPLEVVKDDFLQTIKSLIQK